MNIYQYAKMNQVFSQVHFTKFVVLLPSLSALPWIAQSNKKKMFVLFKVVQVVLVSFRALISKTMATCF